MAPEIIVDKRSDLPATLARRFEDRWERVRLLLPYADGDRLSELYALGTPIEQREDTREPLGWLLQALSSPP